MDKKIGLSFKKIFLLCVGILLVAKLLFDFNGFWALFKMAGTGLVSLLGYILVGFIIAYILNSYINFLQKKVLKNWTQNPKAKKYLTIAIGYATFAGLVCLFIFMVIPSLCESIVSLGKDIPSIMQKVKNIYAGILERTNVASVESVNSAVGAAVNKAVSGIGEWFDFSLFASIITSTTGIVFNAVMGVMISVYMLIEKENTMNAVDKILYAVFPNKISSRIKWVGRKTNYVFQKYFTGKLIQALIVFIIAYILFSIAQIPYAILFAVIIGIFNMVPYIGPWVGAIPVIVVCLAESFWLGVTAAGCVLLVQALDNFIISPRVIGNQMGVSPLLILIGLCIGGSVFGVPGMIIGDVMAALVKVFFYDTYVEIKARKKTRALKTSVSQKEKASDGKNTEKKATDITVAENFADKVDEINEVFLSEDET